jgi:serine/threonine-protein kinase
VAEVFPSDERAEDPSDFGSLRPGTLLGRYELLVPIARGGMARVWAARQHGQRGFQKLVAIKTILPHLAEEPEFERMFLDEARIASGVHHPNVCEIYELGEERRTLYLAMEWANGDALSRVLRPNGGGAGIRAEALDPRVAARIVADACAGAHAAHELSDDDGRPLGVVHRDLSPHNVLLTMDGVAKVCDFGVAKALGQLHDQTSSGQLKGKISYMPPEQVTGSPIDRRSDVFSLGCILYEATTGMRAFRGEGDHQIMRAIMQSEIAPPTSVIRHYPAELERIVLRALAYEPTLRFPTAEQMRFALEEYLARGQLVTQSNVAQTVRALIGDQIERRKERIRQASSAAEQSGWDPSKMPSTRDPADQRSGVKTSRGTSTLQMAGLSAGGTDIRADAVVRPEASASPSFDPQPAYAAPAWHAPDAGPRLSSPGQVPIPIGAPDVASGSFAHVHAPSSNPYGIHDGGPPTGEREGADGGSVGHYAVAALVGLLCAMLIGGGGFLVWRTRLAQAPSPATPLTASASASAAPAAPAPTEIVLRVSPPNAVVLVDGRELRTAKRSMPRPPAGSTVSVSVRAKGYDDATLFVDYFSANPLEITLSPTLEIDTVTPTPTPTPTPTSTPKAASPRPASKRPPAVLPDNPY